MNKKVAFGAQPKKAEERKDADAWVKNRAGETSVAMKRLTIDIPADLHTKLKVAAAARGVRMADMLREWIREGLE